MFSLILRSILVLSIGLGPCSIWANPDQINLSPTKEIELQELYGIEPSQFTAALYDVTTLYDSMEGVSLSASVAGEYLLFQAERAGEALPAYICHLHTDAPHHCDPVNVNEVPLEVYQPFLSVTPSDMANLMGGAEMLAQYDPSVMIWIAIGAASFYLVKKGINKYLFGQFLAREADGHSHLILSDKALHDQAHSRQHVAQDSVASLHEIVTAHESLAAEPAPVDSEQLKQQASEMLAEDARLVIKQLVHAATGHKCSHSHGHDHDHSKCGSSKKAAQTELKRGAVFGWAKTMGVDLYRELIRPIYLLGKGALDLVRKRSSRKQLTAFARIEANRMLTETDALFTLAFLGGVFGLKVGGETLETLVVGPYHAFCHISDAAVLVVGMSAWASYHCVRQAGKFAKFGSLVSAKYWSLIFASFKDRLSVATRSDAKVEARAKADDSKAVFLALRMLNRELKILIRQKNAREKLSNSRAGQLARWLGVQNKRLEDLATRSVMIERGHVDSADGALEQDIASWFEQNERIVKLTMSWSEEIADQVRAYYAGHLCRESLSKPN